MNSRMEVALETLRDSIARWTNKGDQQPSAVPALSLFREDAPTEPMSAVYEPSICMVVQGAKRVLLGNELYVYNDHQYLITSVDLPRGGATASDCGGGQPEPTDSAGNCVAEKQLHSAASHR